MRRSDQRQGSGVWADGVLLTFDLVMAELERYYSAKNPQNAYNVIKRFLIQNGFEHLRDTDYKNPNIDKVDTVDLLYHFSQKNKWFPFCVSKVNISPNVITLDIADDIKALRDGVWGEERTKNGTA